MYLLLDAVSSVYTESCGWLALFSAGVFFQRAQVDEIRMMFIGLKVPGLIFLNEVLRCSFALQTIYLAPPELGHHPTATNLVVRQKLRS